MSKYRHWIFIAFVLFMASTAFILQAGFERFAGWSFNYFAILGVLLLISLPFLYLVEGVKSNKSGLEEIQSDEALPEVLEARQKPLLELGFEPFSHYKTKGGSYHQWVYFLPEAQIYAFINASFEIYKLTSYYENGFRQTTFVKYGGYAKSSRYIEEIIYTSFEDAYDYHLQQGEHYLNKYGKRLAFENIFQIESWEKRQEQQILDGELKGVGRLLLGYLVTASWYIFFLPPSGENVWNLGVAIIAPIIFAIVPSFFSKQFKKKKD